MRYDVGRFRRPMRRGAMEQLVSLISLGDGSTLTLDFTTGVLDPRLTFTRGSDATFINSSGFVQYADANYLARSETFDGSPWTLNGVSQTSAAITNPVGGSSSRLIEVTASGGSKSLIASMAVSAGFQYTFRIWVRAGASSSVSIGYYSGTAFLNITMTKISGPGTVAGGTGSAPQLITGLTSDWTQVQIVLATIATAVNGSWFIYPNGTANAVGNSVYLWGAQANIGATANPYYVTTTSAYFAPRFDYDPTTLAPRGLLLEGQAANLATYSEDYSQAVWTKNNIDRTTGQSSPDNATGATLISENTTSYAKHSLERTITITPGVHTLSVWVKGPNTDSRRYVCVQLADGQAIAARYTIVADLQTGTITAFGANNGTAGAPTNTDHRIIPYLNGWYRLTITMNCVASPLYPAVILSDISTLFGGNNQPFYSASSPYKGLIVWGAQLETGSSASSYIPTGASTATRNADECVMTGTNFSSWFNAGSSYSMLFRYSLNNPSAFAGASVDRCAGTLSVSGGGNRTFIHAAYRTTSGSGDEGRFVRVFDTGSLDLSPATLPAAASNTRLAFAVDTNNAGLSAANQSLGTDSGCTILTGQNQLELGKVGSSQFINGCISLVKYWPTRLSNAQLQSLTT